MKHIYGATCRDAAGMTLTLLSFPPAENPQETRCLQPSTQFDQKWEWLHLYPTLKCSRSKSLWPLQVEQIPWEVLSSESDVIFLYNFFSSLFGFFSPCPLLSHSSTCTCVCVANIKLLESLWQCVLKQVHVGFNNEKHCY